jgi:DNA-directed RNA polymerase subunit RPC12/RpoP
MKRSNCCSYPIKEDTDLCGMCGEHCEELEKSPFYIVKWDLSLMCSAAESIDDYEIIKELEDEVKFESGIIKIDDKFYRVCHQNFKLNFISVEEIKEPSFEETSHNDDEIVCPNCGSEFSDSWEYSDSGTIECCACGSDVFYEREISVSYNSSVARANKNIKEL